MIRMHWLKRRWFAEDVALAFEMQADGIELWAIAHHYGTTTHVLSNVMSQARKYGMGKYPSRTKMTVRRLLPPPSVSGRDAPAFLARLELRA